MQVTDSTTSAITYMCSRPPYAPSTVAISVATAVVVADNAALSIEPASKIKQPKTEPLEGCHTNTALIHTLFL